MIASYLICLVTFIPVCCILSVGLKPLLPSNHVLDVYYFIEQAVPVQFNMLLVFLQHSTLCV